MLFRDVPEEPARPVEAPPSERAAARAPGGPARRVLDNPRVIGAVAALLVGLLVGLAWLSERTGTGEIVSPLLSDVLLYVLYAVDLTILAALLFVLARNLLKLWVEQRRAAPFARFRAKLVGALLAMTIVPAVLVLISGSQIISSSTQRWLSEPVDRVLQIANDIAREYVREHQASASVRAQRLAGTVPAAAIAAGDEAGLRSLLLGELTSLQRGKIELYRTIEPTPGELPQVAFVTGGDSGVQTRDSVQASADRLALQAVTSGEQAANVDELGSGGLLVRSAWPIDRGGQRVGAVVVSELIPANLSAQLRQAASQYENYQAIKLTRGWLEGVYLALFVMVTLLILVSATWFGLYLAKRITRPVQMLAEGAKAIGEGKLDLRIEPETGDELGSLVESFNMMAAELRTSQDKLEQSRQDLQHKNVEIEGRRRYIETVLERVATGVLSLGPAGEIETLNGAATRLLGVDRDVLGQPASAVFAREDLRPLLPLVEAAWRRDPVVLQEIMLAREEREIHLAAAATILTGEAGWPEGAVLVLDDVTPLIRAQRVAAWRDVARRLAHEIKNPLTPIQLSAERLRRNFSSAPPNARALVEECTGAIVIEVEALKTLVDEFAQFARLRGPRTLPADLNRLVEDTLRLYAGVLQQASLRVENRLAPNLPLVRIDAEQIRQVVINLVDNAMEALGGPHGPPRPDGTPPVIAITTGYDQINGVVRLVVSDNGPGVPSADREKLFMPYYSTKGRGSGLGLAIVRRIVAEHGGGIDVGDATPKGTVFTVELPAA
jgi:two-component system nitrogen regulation sensor histidine kinase NtrY